MPRDLVLTDVDRRVALRQLSGFEQLSEEVLAAIAALSGRRSYRAGSVIVRAGEPRTSMSLLLDGDLQLMRNGRLWPQPRERLDLLWLARDRAPVEVRTAGGADLLELPHEGLEELLHEHFSIALTLLGGLASHLSPHDSAVEVRADSRHTTLTRRVEALADGLPFARDYVDALLQLEADAVEVRFSKGETFWQPGETADYFVVPLDGTLAGVKWLDVLAGQGRSTRARAITPSIALRVGAESLIDVLEDHHALTRDLLASLAREVVALVEREGA